MPNTEKINRLEHELGRYKKKILDLNKVIDSLRKELMDAEEGARELQHLVDALLTAVVLEYGAPVKDPDAPELSLGWRLTLQNFSVEEMRKKYEIHARRDKGFKYLGVVERKEEP